ncbi:hypothetical protein KA977_07680 [Candidatus Dependentiae bacterium]|nr:hypothetical protein [Candidatus Dependentiae bacterium]
MAYPFERSCTIPYETSTKLKILATAEGIPITKMIVKIIDEYYLYSDKTKIGNAISKLNIQAGDRNV